MNNYKIIILIIATLSLQSCELFVIGVQQAPKIVVDIDQNSALGSVFLFKAELDSNNTRGAAQVIANGEGQKYLAIERQEQYFEIDRVKRLLANRTVTLVKADTLSNTMHRFQVEFDYLFFMDFTASKINEKWYVTNFNNKFKQSYVLK